MATANQALKTGPDEGVTVVFAQLLRLVHPAVAVTQVGRLRGSNVDS